MTSTFIHEASSELVRAFCDAWEGAEASGLSDQLTADARLESNLFGTFQGPDSTVDALMNDLAHRAQLQITQ
jgi:hypothetical protein